MEAEPGEPYDKTQGPESHAFRSGERLCSSSRFYRDLGFAEIASIDKAVRFERDGYGFWLQDYYVDDWAGNFMLCLYVDDMNAWWSHIKAMAFDETYGSTARVLAEPHDQEGGLMMQFSDPSGVL
jgi:glyoxalase/bleomycin resistance protein/dioxygenase superfamily protein